MDSARKDSSEHTQGTSMVREVWPPATEWRRVVRREIYKRHWMARRKAGFEPCTTCGNEAMFCLCVIDDEDVVQSVVWFCDEHTPSDEQGQDDQDSPGF